MKTRAFIALAGVAVAVLIWAMISPLLGLNAGQLRNPAAAGPAR